ncbi:MAG: CopG family transcriptional regulator [Epsilonproteobacteria bacterium]|nr:CopG family transcriptional regulator [Campylobacterota bacterium]
MSTEEFDSRFDNGEDISEFLDFEKAESVDDFEKKKFKVRKVNVDFPQYIIDLLDEEARKIGVTRQSIIKVWIAERLKEEKKISLI